MLYAHFCSSSLLVVLYINHIAVTWYYYLLVVCTRDNKSLNVIICFQRLLTDESPRLRNALRYTIYGKSGIFDAERFIDVMQAFESFITAAKSGGGEELSGDMAGLGIVQSQTNFMSLGFPSGVSQTQPIQTRAALAFLLSEKGNFFREFLLDEVLLHPIMRLFSPHILVDNIFFFLVYCNKRIEENGTPVVLI